MPVFHKGEKRHLNNASAPVIIMTFDEKEKPFILKTMWIDETYLLVCGAHCQGQAGCVETLYYCKQLTRRMVWRPLWLATLLIFTQLHVLQSQGNNWCYSGRNRAWITSLTLHVRRHLGMICVHSPQLKPSVTQSSPTHSKRLMFPFRSCSLYFILDSSNYWSLESFWFPLEVRLKESTFATCGSDQWLLKFRCYPYFDPSCWMST